MSIRTTIESWVRGEFARQKEDLKFRIDALREAVGQFSEVRSHDWREALQSAIEDADMDGSLGSGAGSRAQRAGRPQALRAIQSFLVKLDAAFESGAKR